MKSNDFRLKTFILALIVSFIVFLGGYYLYKQIGVEQPAVAKLSSLIKGQANIEKNGGIYEVMVEPRKLENLQQSWTEMNTLLEKQLKGKNYRIVIKDQPNRVLQLRYETLQPAIYEALAQDHYVWLKEEIDKALEGTNINYRLYIDDQNLYLQMEQGNYYLYQVIKRENHAKTQEA